MRDIYALLAAIATTYLLGPLAGFIVGIIVLDGFANVVKYFYFTALLVYYVVIKNPYRWVKTKFTTR